MVWGFQKALSIHRGPTRCDFFDFFLLISPNLLANLPTNLLDVDGEVEVKGPLRVALELGGLGAGRGALREDDPVQLARGHQGKQVPGRTALERPCGGARGGKGKAQGKAKGKAKGKRQA